MLKGKAISAERAVELGILDEIAPGDVVEHAVAFAHRIVNDPSPQAPRKRRISEREAIIGDGLPLQAGPFVVAQAHKMVPPEANGGFAAHKLIDAVQAAVELAFPFGLAREARLFDELVRSAPSPGAAPSFSLRSANCRRFPGCRRPNRCRSRRPASSARERWAAASRSRSRKPASRSSIVDSNDEAVDKARQTVMGMFMYQVQKGTLTQEEAWKRGQSITFTDDWNALHRCRRHRRSRLRKHGRERDVFAKLDGDRQTRSDPCHQHVDARHRRHGGRDLSAPASSSACTSSCRPTSCRCSKSCAARRRRRRRWPPRSNSASGCARTPCFRPTPSASSAIA